MSLSTLLISAVLIIFISGVLAAMTAIMIEVALVFFSWLFTRSEN